MMHRQPEDRRATSAHFDQANPPQGRLNHRKRYGLTGPCVSNGGGMVGFGRKLKGAAGIQ